MKQQSGGMAALIRSRFHTSGLSIKQLADRSGVYYSAAHGFINGNRDATLTTAEKLCSVLGLQLRPVKPLTTESNKKRSRKPAGTSTARGKRRLSN